MLNVNHDLEALPDARRRWGIRQFVTNLLDRRATPAVEDVHDLAFASGEMEASGLRHRSWAKFFAQREYIRSTASCQVGVGIGVRIDGPLLGPMQTDLKRRIEVLLDRGERWLVLDLRTLSRSMPPVWAN